MTDETKLSTADIARGTTATEEERATDAPTMDRTSTESSTFDQSPAPDYTGNRSMEGSTAPARRVEHPDDDDSAPLFAGSDAEAFRARWTEIQAGFVDDPRSSVERADGLVAEVIKNLADAFATERSGLEQRWQQGGDPSTEDLRVALRRYRTFFDRLLSV
jgi:hypothetical protein